MPSRSPPASTFLELPLTLLKAGVRAIEDRRLRQRSPAWRRLQVTAVVRCDRSRHLRCDDFASRWCVDGRTEQRSRRRAHIWRYYRPRNDSEGWWSMGKTVSTMTNAITNHQSQSPITNRNHQSPITNRNRNHQSPITNHTMKLSLGPLLYYWPVKRLSPSTPRWSMRRSTRCIWARRCVRVAMWLRLADWLDIAEVMAAASKEVVLSSRC